MHSRRVVQWGAILLLLTLPLISRGDALYQALGPGAKNVRQLAGAWGALLFDAYSWLFGGFAEPAAVGDLFQGSFWSITLFGFAIADPMALLGHMAATGAVHWPLAVGALTPLVIAAFAGRFFCGWICPVNTILELNHAFRRWIERRIVLLRLPNLTLPTRARYLVLFGGLMVSAIAGFNVFALILPYIALARDWHLAVYGAGVGFGVLFMVVLLAVELVFAPHLWCRSLCPTGLVLSLAGRWRAVGIARKPQGECVARCSLCISVCPTGVNPRDGIAADQCMNCNICVAQCPAEILTLGVHRPRRQQKAVMLGAVALLLWLGPSDAMAHHIKGMPHYGYIENYPQTPTFEVTAAAPPYSVTLVAYLLEGLDRSRSNTPDDVMIYVTVTDTVAEKAYTGPLSVTIRPVGGGNAVRRRFKIPLEETVYRLRASLPGHDYDVAVAIDDAGNTTAHLRLPLGHSHGNRWLIASLALVAAAFAAITVIFMRRRRWRQRAG